MTARSGSDHWLLQPMATIALAMLSAAASAQGTAAPETGQPQIEEPAPVNDLSRLPLDSLWATRERPLFLPSRRAPSPPASLPAHAVEMPPTVAVAEVPHLVLLGTIRSSDTVRSAVLLDEMDQASVNLKVGDNRRGWVLESISRTGVSLRKDGQQATLAFAPAFPPTAANNPAVGTQGVGSPPPQNSP